MTDQTPAGAALKPLYGHWNYLKDPDGLARIRESLTQTPDWHDPAPINCNSLARLLDTIEALRTPASGAVEAARKALEPFARAAGKLDGLWADDDCRWNDPTRSGVTVAHIRAASTALAALTSEPKAEGEWTELKQSAQGVLDARSALTTHTSTWPKLDAATTRFHNVLNRLDETAVLRLIAQAEAAPQPLQGGEVTREAVARLNAFLDVLDDAAGRQVPFEVSEGLAADLRALISRAQREGEE